MAISFVFKVTARVDGTNIGNIVTKLSSQLGDSDSIPALGLAWSHCINTRISLHRNSMMLRLSNSPSRNDTSTSDELHGSENKSVTAVSTRTLVLEFSPMKPANYCVFQIRSEGIYGVYS